MMLKWFNVNEMTSNDDMCHRIVANQDNISITLGNECIEAEDSVELLGIKIDKNLNFNDHVSDLIRKGNQKLHALARISRYSNQGKLNIIMKTFILSQFNYCSLTWMFHRRILNNKINKLHEKALRLVYKKENLTFQDLLELDNSVTVHQKNLQKLATEMYKVKNNLSPLPIQDLFTAQVTTHHLRNKGYWDIPKTKTVCYGIESVRYRGPKTWELLSDNIKQATSSRVQNKNKKMESTRLYTCADLGKKLRGGGGYVGRPPTHGCFKTEIKKDTPSNSWENLTK